MKIHFTNSLLLLLLIARTACAQTDGQGSSPAAAPSATAPSAPAPHPAPLRIAIIGDSTVCEYPQARADRGWGQFIEQRFKEGAVKVLNRAASGRSTKTFIQEGRWQ
ncbi:MAG TPA: hypothetical protein VNT26_06035, partial [Candidatus Sulfotelmatobacter sp.]|nr:hypothetical protein [Candidatus Sulfotelmatobacter sp.]